MTIDEIKGLIGQIDKSTLTEFVYEKDGEKLILSKKQKAAPQNMTFMQPMGMMAAPSGIASGVMAPAGAAAPAPLSGASETEHDTAADPSVEEIRSPYVGTILLNEDNSNVPLVNVGDRIKKGQKLCQIEAMKMYNDVSSPIDGKILSIEVDHGDIVECDQLLFKIEKG